MITTTISPNKLSALFLSCCLFLFACTKDKGPEGTSSLAMFNALSGSDTLVANFKESGPQKWYKNASMIVYGTSTPGNTDTRGNVYNTFVGNQRLRLYRYPDTLAQHNPLYDLSLNLEQDKMYSLFLTGKDDAPDTLFVRDQPPYLPSADSTMGVRFVNLSPGIAPVTINIKGKPDGSEAGELTYKEITGFRSYEVKKATSDYVFEFRDKATGTLLGSYTAMVQDRKVGLNFTNALRYKHFTMILYGLPGVTTGKYRQAVHFLQH